MRYRPCTREKNGPAACDTMRGKDRESNEGESSLLYTVCMKCSSGAVAIHFSLHHAAIAALSGWRVRVLSLADGAPDRWNEMVFCRFTILDQTCASLADTYSGPSKIITETLIVLGQTTKLEFGHGLLMRTGVHGGKRVKLTLLRL